VQRPLRRRENTGRERTTAARASSCTGKINVLGHSMGATLAARRISKLGLVGSLHAFVGIAGAFRRRQAAGQARLCNSRSNRASQALQA
jgi:pimeloyl-ACP methyl ester carboxylesterase